MCDIIHHYCDVGKIGPCDKIAFEVIVF